MVHWKVLIGCVMLLVVAEISDCQGMSTKGQKFASSRGDEIPSETGKTAAKLASASASASATTTTEDPFSFGAEPASRFVRGFSGALTFAL